MQLLKSLIFAWEGREKKAYPMDVDLLHLSLSNLSPSYNVSCTKLLTCMTA